MLRATREFIRARQPHTDFVVGTVAVRPYERPIHRWEIEDTIRDEVRRDGRWRACCGWRVSGYDALRDETRFEPWWWIIDEKGQAWDVDPAEGVAEYILDQALVIYRRERFEQRLPIRPPDLYLASGSWLFRQGGQDHPLTQLDQANLTSVERQREVQMQIIATNLT